MVISALVALSSASLSAYDYYRPQRAYYRNPNLNNFAYSFDTSSYNPAASQYVVPYPYRAPYSSALYQLQRYPASTYPYY